MAKTTQTVRINGVRTVIQTIDGKVTTKPALPLEWEVQAASVTALKLHPQYKTVFALAGDFNAAKRSKNESAKAVATGIAPGEHDLRIYMQHGKLGLIEYKVGAPVSSDQKERHALLHSLGFTRQEIIKVKSTDEGARQTLEIVNRWIKEIEEEYSLDETANCG